jgi:hypothetical protein
MERTKKNGEELPKNEKAPETPETPEAPETPETPEVEDEKPEPTFVDPDPVIKWRKLGGGSLHLPKQLVPPGATFKARASEIPKAFRNMVQPLEELPPAPEAPAVKPVKSAYKVVPRGKSKSMFDVIGPNGKKMNELPLTKATAERLVKDLS